MGEAFYIRRCIMECSNNYAFCNFGITFQFHFTETDYAVRDMEVQFYRRSTIEHVSIYTSDDVILENEESFFVSLTSGSPTLEVYANYSLAEFIIFDDDGEFSVL